jgi:hypothetical protein
MDMLNVGFQPHKSRTHCIHPQLIWLSHYTCWHLKYTVITGPLENHIHIPGVSQKWVWRPSNYCSTTAHQHKDIQLVSVHFFQYVWSVWADKSVWVSWYDRLLHVSLHGLHQAVKYLINYYMFLLHITCVQYCIIYFLQQLQHINIFHLYTRNYITKLSAFVCTSKSSGAMAFQRVHCHKSIHTWKKT